MLTSQLPSPVLPKRRFSITSPTTPTTTALSTTTTNTTTTTPATTASTSLASLLGSTFNPAAQPSAAPTKRPRTFSYTFRDAMPVFTMTTNGAATANGTAEHTPDVTEAVGGKRNVEKLKQVARDFRSDTFTIPSDAQLLAMLQASRGDDVYSEDPDTAALEARLAKLSGKEAALFGASGTMTNQVAIRTHMRSPPHSVITDHRAHVHMLEAGGIAMFSQATTHGLVPANGVHLTVEDIRPALQLGDNIHIAPTKLICLENTLSGTVFPQDEVVRIGELAREHGIAMHLDGARAWNVAAAEVERRGLEANDESLTTVLSDILAPFDSASLCLSKGIGAPIGSAIVGTKEFIATARRFRKMFGGGWRQSGGLAAATDYALTHHFPRLAGTHALARRLAKGLREAGCDIVAPVDTNMVFFDPTPAGFDVKAVCDALAALPAPIYLGANRCVIHHQTDPQAVEDFIATVQRLADAVPDEDRPPKKKQKLGAKDGNFRVNVKLGY